MANKAINILLGGSLLLSFQAHSQNLVLDSLYGANGKIGFNTVTSPDYIRMIDLQNGYVLHTGYNIGVTNDSHIDLVKADYCGNLDSTFGTNGLAHHKFDFFNTLFNASMQSDGKILTCGIQSPSNAASEQIPYVARFLSNGSPDTTFGNGGSVSLRFEAIASGRFTAVNQLPDGRIVCSGLSYNNINGGVSGFGAMRFLPDGNMDNTFSSDGMDLYIAFVEGGLSNGFITPDLDVIHVAAYRTNSNVTHLGAVCWDSTGSVNTSFGSGGVFFDSTDAVSGNVYSFRGSNGSITMASTKTGVSFQSLMIRITANGTPDPTFGTGGRKVIVHPDIVEIKGIKQMPGGKILVIGQSSTGGGCFMLNSNGSIDTLFGNMGYMAADLDLNTGTHFARDMSILTNGQWLFGGTGAGFLSSRYDDVSNVPHITQVITFLQTTGTGSYQWYLNGSAIPGAVHDTLHFTQNGSYTVLLTGDYGCSYMSEPFIVTNSGVAETTEPQLLAFPNPVHDVLYLQFAVGAHQLSLMSADGKELLNQNISDNSDQLTLDLSGFATGVYWITIRNTNTVTVKRIVKL